MHAIRGFLSKTWSTVASSTNTKQRMQPDNTPEGGHRIQKYSELFIESPPISGVVATTCYTTSRLHRQQTS